MIDHADWFKCQPPWFLCFNILDLEFSNHLIFSLENIKIACNHSGEVLCTVLDMRLIWRGQCWDESINLTYDYQLHPPPIQTMYLNLFKSKWLESIFKIVFQLNCDISSNFMLMIRAIIPVYFCTVMTKLSCQNFDKIFILI